MSRRRLADHAGFVLPSAVILLLVITLLTGAAVSVATQTSSSTTSDNGRKAALEAAEAGLQVAAYRISQIKPEEARCITGNAEAAPTSGVYCAGSSVESLGNNATFQYWTSKALAVGEKCAGQTIEAKSGVAQRCITAEGKVAGVEPGTRLQTLMQSSLGEKLFSIKGILGLSEVLVSGNVTATAVVASNEKIVGEGSATFEKGFELCPPKGTFKPKVGSERNSSGVAVGTVRGGYVGDPPLEKERSASECQITAPLPSSHASAALNEDIRISNGEDPNTGEAKGLKYNAAKYELEAGANVKLSLKGAKYYFCKFVVTSNGEVKIPAGGDVEIFIGSHAENSACPAEKSTNDFEIAGAAKIENSNGPNALLIEMAGEGPLSIGASAKLTANIYAPKAEVVLSGAGALTGALVGNKVKLTAGSFIYSEESGSLTVGGSGVGYKRAAWSQCTAGSGATEGC